MVEYPRQGVDLSYGPTQHANMELCVRPTTKAKGSATYYFRLKDLTCNIACSQYAALTMAPGDVAEAPRIVSPLAATVTVDRASAGAAMAYQALASGSEPSTWEATPLPAGYGLFGNVITEDGTPSTPGTYNVTLTARNAYGSDTKTLALTVLNNQPPEMTLRISAEVGAPFLYTIRASGNGPMSNVITCVGSSELPFGLSYDGTNTIRGVPLEAGTSKLRVTAQNGVGGPACSMVIILAITGGGGPADADGDGMLDAWEIQYFGSTNAPDGAAGADADGDGMSNLAECRAGTNPKDPASVLAVSGAALGSGADQFVVSWGSVSGKSYGVDKRTNLVGAAWQVVAGGIPGSPPVNTYTDSVGQTAAGFYRVKVE
jgi:PKD repeat protein